MPVNGQTLA